jgi:ATP-dependent RNA helicase DDX56/DBP9
MQSIKAKLKRIKKKIMKTFVELGIQDKRLLRALEKQEIREPTLIQEASLPIIISEKRDVLVKAKTGSGKTLIFVLPILVRLLQYVDELLKKNNLEEELKKESCMAIIMVPSKELAGQVTAVIENLLVYFPLKQIQLSKMLLNLNAIYSGKKNKLVDASQDIVLKSIIREQGGPFITVGTPSRILSCLEQGLFSIQDSLQYFAIDEADLIMGFGYEQEMTTLMTYLPKSYQGLLLSATLDTSLESLKTVYLRSPAIVKLEENQEEKGDGDTNVCHYYLPIPDSESEDYKYLVLFALFKLKLLKGKCLVFTHDSDAAYRLKLFLEMFYIRSVVLNGELPIQSRIHVVEEANKGRYDCIIAADSGQFETAGGISTKKPYGKTDTEYGVSRGIDFKNITTVLNFNCPFTEKHYMHRTGRTGRGVRSGIALTLVDKNEKPLFTSILKSFATAKLPKEENSDQNETNLSADNLIQRLSFDYSALEGFRYRCMDAIHSVTKNFILEARAKDLQKEMAFNTKLAENSALLTRSIGSLVQHPDSYESRKLTDCIVHDKSLLKPGKQQKYLKNIPEYLFLATTSNSEDNDANRKAARSRHIIPSLPADFEEMQQKALAQNRSVKTAKSPSGKANRSKAPKNPLKKLKL